MPYADLKASRLYYVVDVAEDLPVLLFSNALGNTADAWAWQVPELSKRFRVVRYDTRGHGRSSLPDGEYAFSELADEAIDLLTFLGIGKAAMCGISMGGMVAMQTAAKRPDLISKLVLCCTAARIGSVEGWRVRIAAVEADGLAAIAPTLAERWCSPGFSQSHPGHVQLLIDMLRRTSDEGYIRNVAALRDGDLTAEVRRIVAPTLIISGRNDQAVTTPQAVATADLIPGARHIALDAAHEPNWEKVDRYIQALLEFLSA